MSLYRPGVGYGEPTCPLATRRHPEQPGSVWTGVTGQAPTQTLYDKSSPGGAWMQIMPVPPRDVCCQVCSCQNRVESTPTKNSILPNQPCIRSRSCISYGGRQFTVPAVWPLDYFRSNSAHKEWSPSLLELRLLRWERGICEAICLSETCRQQGRLLNKHALTDDCGNNVPK